MEDAWGIKSDDVIIIGVVVVLGALLALGLQRVLRWRNYPYWIVIAALVLGVLLNNWLTHAVQPRF
jgi:hypothetical protein